MIKAVFCDLDGTLLHGECETRVSHNSIPKFNHIMLQKLIDSGVKFIPSSGRSYWDMADIVAGYEYNYLVSNNGTTVHKDGEIVLNNVVAREDARKVNEVLANNDITFMINSVENSYYHGIEHLTPARYEFVSQYFDLKRLDNNILEKEVWISFCAFTNMNFTDLHQLELKLKNLVGDKFDILPSGMDCIDIVIKDVNKGSGAEFVMDLEDWAWDEVATVGDNLNDVAMLKQTPHSFAMSHGRTKAKACAGYTIDVACQAFEKILEINEAEKNG